MSAHRRANRADRLVSGDAGCADHSFGGPEVLDIVDIPEPTPGPGQELCDVSTAGINFADTHHSPS